MFIEPNYGSIKEGNSGWIEVICGCMFSGKTEELIRRLNRAKIAGQKVIIFKPQIDNRYHETKVVSHKNSNIDSIPIKEITDVINQSEGYEVVGIDEAQFFDEKIVSVCNHLAKRGQRVLLSGLDMDFEGKAFGAMPELLAIAEYVTKLHAICMKCGSNASFSFRLSENKKTVLVGEKESYEARCRTCFEQGQEKEQTLF
jgi:thymidine kinase